MVNKNHIRHCQYRGAVEWCPSKICLDKRCQVVIILQIGNWRLVSRYQIKLRSSDFHQSEKQLHTELPFTLMPSRRNQRVIRSRSDESRTIQLQQDVLNKCLFLPSRCIFMPCFSRSHYTAYLKCDSEVLAQCNFLHSLHSCCYTVYRWTKQISRLSLSHMRLVNHGNILENH